MPSRRRMPRQLPRKIPFIDCEEVPPWLWPNAGVSGVPGDILPVRFSLTPLARLPNPHPSLTYESGPRNQQINGLPLGRPFSFVYWVTGGFEPTQGRPYS